MRAVIQRVASASVSADGEIISSIKQGLCVLIGISRNDRQQDIDYMVRKILNIKLFDGVDGKRWSQSVMDKGFEVLCLSQITLYHTLKGNKPDFHNAMQPDLSQQFYKQFLSTIREQYNPDLIKEGKFGAYIIVNIQNDGPVTINLESPVTSLPSARESDSKCNDTKEIKQS